MKDDLMDEFKKYRDAAMKTNESRLGPGAFERASAQLKTLLEETWPEAALANVEDRLPFQEVMRGHTGGALCELAYEVGDDALGRRLFLLTWSEDAREWRWAAATYDRERGYVPL